MGLPIFYAAFFIRIPFWEVLFLPNYFLNQSVGHYSKTLSPHSIILKAFFINFSIFFLSNREYLMAGSRIYSCGRSSTNLLFRCLLTSGLSFSFLLLPGFHPPSGPAATPNRNRFLYLQA